MSEKKLETIVNTIKNDTWFQDLLTATVEYIKEQPHRDAYMTYAMGALTSTCKSEMLRARITKAMLGARLPYGRNLVKIAEAFPA